MDATQRDSDSTSLSEGTMAADPMTQFARWMADAQRSVRPEPTAMVLATAAADGRPRARTVLLKGHDQTGFTFYTNRTSRKGRDIAANPRACVVFPGTHCSARSRPRAAWSRCRARTASRTSGPGRTDRKSEPGPAGSRRSSAPAMNSTGAPRNSSSAGRRRPPFPCPTSGAATCSYLRRSSSGRGASIGCTTASVTGVTMTAGPSSASLPERPRVFESTALPPRHSIKSRRMRS